MKTFQRISTEVKTATLNVSGTVSKAQGSDQIKGAGERTPGECQSSCLFPDLPRVSKLAHAFHTIELAAPMHSPL